jgi:hypothetical protein
MIHRPPARDNGPIRPGPQPENQIAPTAEEQLRRVHRRPRPSGRLRFETVLARLADLERRLRAAGVPA